MDTVEGRIAERARRLRKDPTFAEQRLWVLLRDRRLNGIKFRRQVRLGRFVADFVCYRAKLVVEADGGVHRLKVEEDAARDAWLKAAGFTVLRFSNEAIICTPHDILSVIAAAARKA